MSSCLALWYNAVVVSLTSSGSPFASTCPMMRLCVDAALEAKLTQAGGPLEICDQAGRTIGFFQPTPPPGTLKELSPFSDEEIEELSKQCSGRPLNEILSDLNNG